jgi:hypothetical protein
VFAYRDPCRAKNSLYEGGLTKDISLVEINNMDLLKAACSDALFARSF